MTERSPTSPAPPGAHAALPNPFVHDDGVTVADTPAAWALRRSEIAARMLPLLYGPLPPAPAHTRCTELHAAVVRRLGSARLWSYRVAVDGVHAFSLRVFAPAVAETSDLPSPVLLNGDGCWHYASDAVIAAILQRGYAFAQFNRVEVVPDVPGDAAQAEQARLFGTARFAALAAWAWAYHRAVDALLTLPHIDGARVAIVGHSRGGKAALLAGATDARIALTSANDSGAGGAGCWRWQAPGAEGLADITGAFPHWFAPGLAQFAGREAALPFDQHHLQALVAPRALLTTEARGDAWANPQGSWQTHRAAREVFAFLGAADRIATRYRDGGHDHAPEDWRALLDFCDAQWGAGSAAFAPQDDPFPGLAPAHAWQRPGGPAAPPTTAASRPAAR